MIASDQPTCFPTSVLAAVSSRSDGTMLDRNFEQDELFVEDNRERFCALAGTDYGYTISLKVVYGEDQTYDKIVWLDQSPATTPPKVIKADALITSAKSVGLFLPVADCTATIIYDPVNSYLALIHLGRHSTVAQLANKVVGELTDRGSRAQDLIVWMSPSARLESYVMEWFDQEADPGWRGFIKKSNEGIFLDLPGFNKAALLASGLSESNIHISPINTMSSTDYFSHSKGDKSGRFAVIAMMRG
ncbi:hypothetical protein B7Y94_03035 [Candidatus Saccharibacteria bacterium 32-49-12]|nr:MAG: hypothetical protein B7Y94_03035 [Candidatus Saccharibacteria bacterium 32-49-12]